MLKSLWNHIKKRGYRAVIIVLTMAAIILFSFFYFISRNIPELPKLADRIAGVKTIILLSIKRGENKQTVKFTKSRISSKNELLKFDEINEFPIPNIEMRSLYPLDPPRNLMEVRNGDKLTYHFINGWENHWVHYEIPVSNEIKFINIPDFKGTSAFNDYFFTGINFQHTLLLLNGGYSYSIQNDTFSNDLSSVNDIDIRGNTFTGNNKIIYQGQFYGDKLENEFAPDKNGYNNILTVYSQDDKKIQNLRYGFFPLDVANFRYMIPMDVSPDDKYVFFLSSFDIDNTFNITLCSLNTENYSFNRLFDFKKELQTTFLPDSIKCCPVKDKNLLLLFGEDSCLLYDFGKKKILKRLKKIFSPKSVRWSHDGSKIGILTVYGDFYVYDIDGDNLTEIVKEGSYFDFFWIPEK